MTDKPAIGTGLPHPLSPNETGQSSTARNAGAPRSSLAQQMGGEPQYFELRAGGTLLALEVTQGMRPITLYAGPDMPGVTPKGLALLATRQHAPGSASVPLRGSLLNEIGTGIPGPSGLIGHRDGQDWAHDLRIVHVSIAEGRRIDIHCEDANAKIAANHVFEIEASTGILRARTRVENLAPGPLHLDWCAAQCLPFDQRFDRFLSFTGRWSKEFQIEEVGLFQGSIVRENKAGRTSHDVFPGGILACRETTETTGLAMGFHLAWSGNHKVRIDRHSDGRGFLQAGEMAFPGELRLGENEAYETPEFMAVWSQNGTNAIANAFHDHVTSNVLDPRGFKSPRPVHYNTWEAVYFNHDEAALIALAQAAADVGAERFVLDDGWFGGRRHDAAGLGDWWVSDDAYPSGLHKLTAAVKELGMEFGLWFEPEMVNPDSDLYRVHPDWVLQAEGVEAVPFRSQLTLDLTKAEVFEYLRDKISALVNEYEIAYIKWDMNRDTSHPGSNGRGAMHLQTRAVYRLLDDLRRRHPALEIESCSSGGARADLGILRRTDRIWTSDNNDARERQMIQRGAAHFFPLRVLGSHVGPRRCHITGRELPMSLRVASAMFGHMGMELDLREESEADLATLKAGIALYKQHRGLIHAGTYVALASPTGTNLIGCVAQDKREALFSYAKLEPELASLPSRIHFSGLEPAQMYQIRIIWPEDNPSISAPSIVDAADLLGEGTQVLGAALMGHGIQPPLTFPDTCLIYYLKACE